LRQISRTDLLLTVSDGVEEGYTKIAKYKGEKLMIGNGCDYKFYSNFTPPKSKSSEKKTIFYEGNIYSEKLNVSLLERLSSYFNDWEFWFCGKIIDHESVWNKFLQKPNVKYFGTISPEEIRSLAYQATVGIMPFNETDLLINRSFPLKAFEYVACGLPVVTIPIKSLMSYKNIFHFASTFDEFVLAINDAGKTRNDENLINIRKEEAAKQDYDLKFNKICTLINSIKEKNRINNMEDSFKLKLLSKFYNLKRKFKLSIKVYLSEKLIRMKFNKGENKCAE
jgi:glycosyltransferase involved in cell wall biosynthesis